MIHRTTRSFAFALVAAGAWHTASTQTTTQPAPMPAVTPQPAGTLRPVPPMQVQPPATAPAVPSPRVVPQITIPLGNRPLDPVPPLQPPLQGPAPAATSAAQRATLSRCASMQGANAQAECRRRASVEAAQEPPTAR